MSINASIVPGPYFPGKIARGIENARNFLEENEKKKIGICIPSMYVPPFLGSQILASNHSASTYLWVKRV